MYKRNLRLKMVYMAILDTDKPTWLFLLKKLIEIHFISNSSFCSISNFFQMNQIVNGILS